MVEVPKAPAHALDQRLFAHALQTGVKPRAELRLALGGIQRYAVAQQVLVFLRYKPEQEVVRHLVADDLPVGHAALRGAVVAHNVNAAWLQNHLAGNRGAVAPGVLFRLQGGTEIRAGLVGAYNAQKKIGAVVLRRLLIILKGVGGKRLLHSLLSSARHTQAALSGASSWSAQSV